MQGPKTKAQVVYLDCSPLVRSLLDEIGPPVHMKVFDGKSGRAAARKRRAWVQDLEHAKDESLNEARTQSQIGKIRTSVLIPNLCISCQMIGTAAPARTGDPQIHNYQVFGRIWMFSNAIGR